MLEPFAQIWAADFEFTADPGERPVPICLVARELRSGKLIRLRRDQFGPEPLYPVDENSLFVAFYASAELGCHLALGWPMPARILDLYVEYRAHVNGLHTLLGKGLLDVLLAHGLDGIGAEEKDEMRALAIRGAPFTAEEDLALLDYCQTDVDALARLLPIMAPEIDLTYALLRGRYMAAVAHMEHHGVPIDVEALELLRENWEHIQERLIVEVDKDFGAFEGRSFKHSRWEAYLEREGILWPRLDSGPLALDDDTFRMMAQVYPRLNPMRELRHALSEMRLSDLRMGRDGRNRTLLSPFSARTGRNQPSNTRFIFGPSVWLRGLIRPEPGYALAYVDWSQQECRRALRRSGHARRL